MRTSYRAHLAVAKNRQQQRHIEFIDVRRMRQRIADLENANAQLTRRQDILAMALQRLLIQAEARERNCVAVPAVHYAPPSADLRALEKELQPNGLTHRAGAA